MSEEFKFQKFPWDANNLIQIKIFQQVRSIRIVSLHLSAGYPVQVIQNLQNIILLHSALGSEQTLAQREQIFISCINLEKSRSDAMLLRKNHHCIQKIHLDMYTCHLKIYITRYSTNINSRRYRVHSHLLVFLRPMMKFQSRKSGQMDIENLTYGFFTLFS